jgi:hypothetical protein
MTEINFTGHKKTISYSGIFDEKEVYSILKNRFVNLNYDLGEAVQDVTVREEKNAFIKWEAFKKIDDYTKKRIRITIKIKVEDEVIKNKKKIIDGTISVSMEGLLVKDYDARWEQNILMKVFRAMYDNWIAKSRFDEHSDAVGADINLALDEVKSYLKIKK